MPTTKSECCWVECDKCTANQDSGDYGIPHFDSEQKAQENAENADWVFWKENVWCDRCAPICVCGSALYMHVDDNACDSKNCTCKGFDPAQDGDD